MPHYDYSQGGTYFCTTCVHRAHRHKNLLARVEGDRARLNRFGAIVEECWLGTPNHRPNVAIDEWIVMPNHVHLLFRLDAPLQTEDYIARFGPQPKGSVGLLIGAFKGAAKRDISRARREETVVWQPRFHERVIRNDDELARIRRYIENNPANWTNDRCHPAHPHFEAVWQGFDPDSDWNIA